MMQKTAAVWCALVALCFTSPAFAEELLKENELRVLKTGSTVYIRSRFSAGEDLVIPVGLGKDNRQINFTSVSLVEKSVPMDADLLKNGRYIHRFGDDVAAWIFNGTFIGGNHGASDAVEITSEGHGRTVEDLGSEWRDVKGRKYYLVRIVDKNRLMFLGENTPEGNIWNFEKRLSGTTLTSSSRSAAITFPAVEGEIVKYSGSPTAIPRREQLWPACRIKKQEYLADGKTPLAEGEVVSCKWLDIVQESDIINPGSLLADIIAHPGQERSFTADHLDAVISERIVYRLHPNGSNVIYYTPKVLQEFQLGKMGVIQSQQLFQGEYDTHEYYIPKTLPFTVKDTLYDFCGIQDFSSSPSATLMFGEAHKNISDPQNLPDRFIQFLGRKDGKKTVREVGYAIGYSLVHGITVPQLRAQNVSQAHRIKPTRKSGPAAVDSKIGRIPAGTEFYCIAYRQYFDPRQAGRATSLYWNKQQDDIILYSDYHASVEEDTLKLPPELSGKKIEVVEKTDSLTLHTQGTVPEKGIEVSVAEGYGYVVLKIF